MADECGEVAEATAVLDPKGELQFTDEGHCAIDGDDSSCTCQKKYGAGVMSRVCENWRET